MTPFVKPPIGIENFEEIRMEGFYYVDKTGLITELLNDWGKVNLFTRPRRFGKSLNMNMLKYFFSYGCDPSVLARSYLVKLRRIFVHMQGGFSTA